MLNPRTLLFFCHGYLFSDRTRDPEFSPLAFPLGVIACSMAGDVWAAGCALFLAVTGRTSIFEARTPVGRLHEMRQLYGAAEIEEYVELLGAPLSPIAHAYDRARAPGCTTFTPPLPAPKLRDLQASRSPTQSICAIWRPNAEAATTGTHRATRRACGQSCASGTDSVAIERQAHTGMTRCRCGWGMGRPAA